MAYNLRKIVAPGRCWRIVVLLTVCLGAAGAWCDAGPFQGKTASVFVLADYSGSPAGAERQGPITEAVQQEFATAGFRIVAPERWREEAGKLSLRQADLIAGPAAIAVALAANADIAVTGFYAVQENRILVSVQVYDTRAGVLAAAFLRAWRFNIGFYNSLHSELADLLERVSFSTAPRLAARAEEVRVPQILFTSPQEGMEVLVEGDRSAGRVSGGTLAYGAGGLKAGAALRVEKRLEGYHTAWETVAAAPRTALAPLSKMDRRAWEFDWTLGQVAGVGAALRIYLVPNWLLLGFSDYLYAQPPAVSSAVWVFHNDTQLSVGQYLFFPPESVFRMGISAGLGVLVSQVGAAGISAYGDPYVSLGSPWCEVRLGDASLLLRVDLKVTFRTAASILRPELLHWGGFFPPVTLGVVLPW